MARVTSGGISYRPGRERIDQAKADWKQVRFDSVPGDNEFIPLPEPEPEVVGPKVANYP